MHVRKRPSRLARATSPRFRTAIREQVREQGLEFDEAQLAAIRLMQRPPAHGFYLWGHVGRGKSMLADLFYEAVPTTLKQRFHFHSFFRDLQVKIFETRQPIEETIRQLIGPARVVFFDEFHVHDVADAVYLTKTLEILLELDVLVLATSNYAPTELMPDPMFHDRFEPAIALIESRFEVVVLGDGTDYRRVLGPGGANGFRAGAWRVGAAEDSRGSQPGDIPLDVNGLTVQAIFADDDSATFSFAELCERPFGVTEYLRIAERFDRVVLIGVPDLADASRNALMRLSNLVDVLHYRDQPLDVRSLASPERMRDSGEPPADVERTLSRLATLALVDERARV